MSIYHAEIHGEDTSEIDIELTDDEYRAVTKFVNAINQAWSESSWLVPSINIEARS